MIIWNDGSGNQTQDLKFRNQYLYTGTNKGSIQPTTLITAICEQQTAVDATKQPAAARKVLRNGQIVILRGERTYTVTGQELSRIVQ